ncbi:hypothetical protein D3C87_531050 [compost metagenome]|uniref:hypothetical protein n=1 Tax=Pseudomonas sp. Irchel s3a12 TaxID=2009047 RepID=UPI000BA4B700|nr:hypothetical protein [Pseudomonas sp. Irchel s3a12]
MLDSKLMSEICGVKTVFWAGVYPPANNFVSSPRIFDPSSDFRELPSLHGNFSAVYLTENDLGKFKQWPLIIDEALRLLQHNAKCLLFVRFSQSNLLTLFSFGAFLRRHKECTFELLNQDTDEDGTIVYSMYCTRNSVPPTLSTFEFALITDGRRPEKVIRFIDSVQQVRGIDNIAWSVAICGPASLRESLEQYNEKVRYIDAPDDHSAKGWITKKKNIIVETSNAENLLIAHDRYEIPRGFLDQMFEFGADFSVIVPAQIDLEGNRFPDWVTLGSTWSWSPSSMLQYGDYNPNVYVNGGVIISKRATLLETPWNELLFWNQGEDVELSRCMSEKGITPRLARTVELIVTDSRPGYIYEFARLPDLNYNYSLPYGCTDPSYASASTIKLDNKVSLFGKSSQQLSADGIILDQSVWTITNEGLVSLQRNKNLSVCLEPNSKDLSLEIFFHSNTNKSDIEIKTNGINQVLNWDTNEEETSCTILIDTTILAPNSSQVVIDIRSDTSLVLTAILVKKQPITTQYPILFEKNANISNSILGSGWAAREAWGVWSLGDQSILNLPVPEVDVNHDLNLEVTARGFAPANTKNQLVWVTCNGTPITLLTLSKKKSAKKYSFRLPRTIFKGARTLQFAFTPLSPSSPSDDGKSKDVRKLAVALIKIDAKPVKAD